MVFIFACAVAMDEISLEELIFGKNILEDRHEDLLIGKQSKSSKKNKNDNKKTKQGTLGTNTDSIPVDGETAAQAAWSDEDDNDITIDLSSTNRLKKLRKDNSNHNNKVTGKQLSSLLQERSVYNWITLSYLLAASLVYYFTNHRLQTRDYEWAKVSNAVDVYGMESVYFCLPTFTPNTISQFRITHVLCIS